MFRKLAAEKAGTPVTIMVNGVATEVQEGEPIAAILLRIPPFTTRSTPITGVARAPYCLMGACFECLVEIDGVTSTRSCMVQARGGMVVCRQPSRPDPLKGIGA
jgi:predicted molibdopterin-dependent oxidoreductase YjgC